MSNIRLNPDELEEFAQRYGIEGGNVGDVLHKLDGLISDLGSVWEGGAQRAFEDQYGELRPSFLNMMTLLEDIQMQLTSTAHTLRDTDSDIASKIRG